MYFFVIVSFNGPVIYMSSRPCPKLNPLLVLRKELPTLYAYGDGETFSYLIPKSFLPKPKEVERLTLVVGRS